MSLFERRDSVLMVAELSANHGGKKEIAIDTIKAAADSGADAIKLQTYRPDTITLDSDKDDFLISQNTLWDGRKLYDLYDEAHTPWEWHAELFEQAEKSGLICFSSPFDHSAVDLLEALNVPAYKIASFEITDIPLIAYAASKAKSMIISTGIAELEDIELAVKTCREAGNDDITILKCTSSYPAPIELANLRTMTDITERFGVKVGLSDHTLDHTSAVVATSLGARMIEKHFILDKSLGGPDANFSLEPKAFENMVEEVRKAESALGKVSYELNEKTRSSRFFARSLYVAEDIDEGEILTKKNLRSVRPSRGLHPKHYYDLLGKKVNRKLEKGEAFMLDFLEDSEL